MKTSIALLMLLTYLAATLPVLATPEDANAFLRPKKHLPDCFYSSSPFPLKEFDREKIQAYFDGQKNKREELENWNKQLEELSTIVESSSTGSPYTRGALGKQYERSLLSQYLQCTYEEDRSYLTRFLGTTFPDIAKDLNLSRAITNEYEVVENFLSSYSPSLNAKFKTLEKGDESAQKYKQQIILGALAHSLASLRDNTTRVHNPNLFAKNCHCVLAMLGQISKSGKPVPIASIKLRLSEFTKQLLSER